MFFLLVCVDKTNNGFHTVLPKDVTEADSGKQVQAESLTSLPVGSFEETQGPDLIGAKGRGQCGQLPCTVCEFFNPFGIHRHYPPKLQRTMGKKVSLHKKTVV